MYIPKIDDYLKILTDEEVKNIVAINLSEYFKSTREKLHSRVSEEQNLRKGAGSLYIFLSTSDEAKKYVQTCNQVLLINMYITIMLRF